MWIWEVRWGWWVSVDVGDYAWIPVVYDGLGVFRAISFYWIIEGDGWIVNIKGCGVCHDHDLVNKIVAWIKLIRVNIELRMFRVILMRIWIILIDYPCVGDMYTMAMVVKGFQVIMLPY